MTLALLCGVLSFESTPSTKVGHGHGTAQAAMCRSCDWPADASRRARHHQGRGDAWKLAAGGAQVDRRFPPTVRGPSRKSSTICKRFGSARAIHVDSMLSVYPKRNILVKVYSW